MDRKQANIAFHHSERLKSNLFLVSAALDRLTTMEADRLEGGKEVSKGVLDALRTELNMARRYLEPAKANAIERELFEVEGEIEIRDYAKATGAGYDNCHKARAAPIKFGALRGEEVVGFTAGQYWHGLTTVDAFFVNENFRRLGIGKRLIYENMMKSRVEGLKGVDINEMLWATKYLLDDIKDETKDNPWMDISWFDDDGEGLFGEIRYTDRK